MSKVIFNSYKKPFVPRHFSDDDLREVKFSEFNPHKDFDLYSYTSLTYATKIGNLSEVRRLIYCEDVDVNRGDKNGKTALMYFSDKFLNDEDKSDLAKDLVEELILAGANPDQIDLRERNFVNQVIAEREIEYPSSTILGVALAGASPLMASSRIKS